MYREMRFRKIKGNEIVGTLETTNATGKVGYTHTIFGFEPLNFDSYDYLEQGIKVNDDEWWYEGDLILVPAHTIESTQYGCHYDETIPEFTGELVFRDFEFEINDAKNNRYLNVLSSLYFGAKVVGNIHDGKNSGDAPKVLKDRLNA